MKFPKTFYNWISITGFILVVNSLLLMLILFLVALLSTESNTYTGVFIYIVLPAFLVIGLLLIPIGMLFRFRKKQPEEESGKRWPVMDLNTRQHRNTLLKVSVVTFLFLIVSAMGSYQAFHYTESVEFCGTLCHQVMEPEHTTYMNSPHARVKCVECHVGEGADWYVKSKLSGLYQVYSAFFEKYPRPIVTPLHSLRPARETCEKCHWPQKFYSRKLRSQRSYLADSVNTEWDIDILMKIGPTYSAMGLQEGIHWHINPDFKIEYVAGTFDRESIPWVKMTNLKTGKVTLYENEEEPLEASAMDTLEHRTMDCMDCHNRPSHLYRSPPVYINNAMIAGLIPKDLPYIKFAAMEALKAPFEDKAVALKYIHDTIISLYKTEYPDIYAREKTRIEQAIGVIQGEYQKNAFPHMKVNSTTYLNHIGHLESMGCFRCHSGKHKTKQGEAIRNECDLCHTFIGQGKKGEMKYASVNESMEFIHPVNVKDKWKTGYCSECHAALYE